MKSAFPKKICQKHDNRVENALCLDNYHEGSSICCTKCIMDDHKNCQGEKIFLFKEIEKNIIFIDKERDYGYMKEDLLSHIKDNRMNCNKYYHKLQEKKKDNVNKTINELHAEKDKYLEEFNKRLKMLENELKPLDSETTNLIKKLIDNLIG